MRFAGIVLFSLVLAGAAAAAHGAASPLQLSGMLESAGAPDLGSPPPGEEGELLRFIPLGQFEIGLLLQNKAAQPLVVVDARVLEPQRTLIHQIGTRFHRWHVFKCPPGALCPLHAFGMKPGPSHPHPFALGARKDVGVELDFRLGSCSQIAGASPAAISRLRVTFRAADGAVRNRTFPLGGAELHLRMPKPEDCAQPRSTLSVEGPQRYMTSYYWTEPGSTGDVCTIGGGTLSFASRVYQAGNVLRPVRVDVSLAHFAGTGTYRRAIVSVRAGGRAVYVSRKGLVTVTKATSREIVGTVAAGHRPLPNVKGIPFQISGTMRCSVRR